MADASVRQPKEDLGDAFARLQQSLRGYLRRRLRDPAQVEDLLIEQLAPIYRDTLIATDIQGATMQSLAESQCVSVSAIKSRAVRARAMLKKTLLACCHIELVDGFVSDYHRVTPERCGGKCS